MVEIFEIRHVMKTLFNSYLEDSVTLFHHEDCGMLQLLCRTDPLRSISNKKNI